MTASPQTENGHTDIANELLEFMCLFRIPGECRQVFDCIMRKTWGWHKKEDRISQSQITKMTRIKKQNVYRSLSKLITHKLVIKNDDKLRINKNYPEWTNFKSAGNQIGLQSSKMITPVIKYDYKKSSKMMDTKEKKETIQKKEDLKLEAEDWLQHYRTIRKEPRRKSINSFFGNFIKWKNIYSLEEMKEALQRIVPNSFYDKAMSPEFFFRTKNKNGECDYIGDLLSKKTPTEKELDGITIL